VVDKCSNTAIARSSDLIVFWSDLSSQALGLPRPRGGAARGDSVSGSSGMMTSLQRSEKLFHIVKKCKTLNYHDFASC
jgi:hypothetical protein